ncbi:MAG: tRNA (N6-isopentenyl adenosine(37)-C2)-methylthiotransferase MiaB [Clostridiales Family XIII bacterium]|jgi:tRNA-2-methylthio-N6-dimethylallyladenosine synthase|nr:tRNA (N6-isopentenyl adenosine(37)-C2)-methylthiotransferase MiaB [Clostridiales Family XIII bacterium]
MSGDGGWRAYMEEYAETHGAPPSYFVLTMGCQMNERDSETIAGLLSGMGYAPAASKDEADFIAVNTCSVRENADKRFFGLLGQIKKLREARPGLVVAVCGCMMQQRHIVDEIGARHPWVDIVFGTHNIHGLPRLAMGAVLGKARAVEVWDEGGDIVEGLPARRGSPFKAYVNVMYGCDNFCSYCIVPYTRGRERSRGAGEVLKEAKALARDGVKEIMLLGQNVNSYRGALSAAGGVADFPELLLMLEEVGGLERLRFMTSHPKDLSDRLIDAFRRRKTLCNAIHLPVQSGSTRVLGLMNRGYTKEGYLGLLEKLRDASPGIAVTTDFITGFPGETEEDFRETMDLAERARFDSAFTFLYSPRRGTPAAEYEDRVPAGDKHRRFSELVGLLNAISAEKNAARLGRVERALVEGPAKTGQGIMSGRTDSGRLVNFAAPEGLAGAMRDIRITEAKTFSLFGELLPMEGGSAGEGRAAAGPCEVPDRGGREGRRREGRPADGP